MREEDLGGWLDAGVAVTEGCEGAEGGLSSEVELGFAFGEVGGEAGFIDQSATGQDEAGEFGEGSDFELQGGGLNVHLMIEEAGIESDDAGETPINGSEFAGEPYFNGIHGPDALDVGPDKFLECATVLIGENDGIVRITAVLEGVHGRTGFSSRGGGAPGLGSVHARLVRITIGSHISIVHYCFAI